MILGYIFFIDEEIKMMLILEKENWVWCVVYGLELVVIIIGNIFIIVVFVIIKFLYRKIYLLLISLVVVDFLVGVVVILMFIYYIGGLVINWWDVDDYV